MKSLTKIILFSVLISWQVDAQDNTCFWNLSGVTQLFGPDLDVTVYDSSFCSVIPTLFVHKPTSPYVWELGGIILMTPTGEELFVSFSPALGCLTDAGSKCIDRYSKPIAIAIPSATQPIVGTAFVTIHTIQSEDLYDTISVIVAVNTGTMEISFIDIHLHMFDPEKPDFKINSIRSFSLAEEVIGQKINGIASMNDTGSVIVFGTKGLIRVIEYSGSITERNHDVDPTENLVCSGDEYIGSEDGTIYYSGNILPVAETGLRLKTISTSGAAAENNQFLEHSGDEWNIFNAENLSVQYCSFINTAKGREVQIIDDEYHLHQLFLYDTPTKLTVDTASGLISYINSDPYILNENDTKTAIFSLFDPENNIKWPTVTVHSADTTFPFGCNVPVYGKSFWISFTSDSIKISAPTQILICPDPPCEYYEGPPCTSTVSWKISDTISIKSNNEELRIINGTPSSVKFPGNESITKPQLKTIAGNLISSIRNRRQPIIKNANLNFSVYNIQGKKVPLNSHNCVLLSGTYILHISSGKSHSIYLFSITR
jgi:hypothetical protein